MSIVDAVLVVLLVLAAVSGFRQGLIAAMLTLIGAVAGAIVGIRLAPVLMAWVDDSSAKIALGVACVVVFVGVGEYAGSAVGRSLSRRVTWSPARGVDKTLGLFGHALAVLLVAWLIAIPLASVPVPWLSSALRSSAILGRVDEVVPDGAREIPARLGELFDDSGFPAILDPLAPTPTIAVEAPDPALAADPVVAAVRPSILKIKTSSEQCGRGTEGSGFVVGDGRVMTNAHVVAGSSRAIVEVEGERLPADVVVYDAERDLAVLDVEGLDLPALTFAAETADTGQDAIVAGYPLDGPFTVTPARIRQQVQLRGPDIYSSSQVVRDVYTVRGSVRSGNSGGPLLATDGEVLGVVFGASIDDPDVGFVLTAEEVAPVLAQGLAAGEPVATGACAAA